jgi:epoxyqueuosine reductase
MPNSISEAVIRDAIRARAQEEGFDAVGFARAASPPNAAENLSEYLARGLHGDMAWMETTQDRRADPVTLWPGAKSVVMLGVNYGPEENPMAALTRTTNGAISAYAQNADYHDVLKKRLRKLAEWIAQTYGAEVKLFVDTAPVMEKPLAQQAHLGWQGKHTNLVSRDFGSWLFLGSVFTDLDLPPDEPEGDHCGACSRCLDICPTQAFPAPYRIDARRCISYLTIEHKGHIAREFRKPIGNRIYGCDDCLSVCPWNKFAHVTREAAFIPREELKAPLLARLARLDDAAFRALFSKSPVKRIGRERFLRNVLIAIGNSQEPALASSAEHLLGDHSPLVRAMAVWALKQLVPHDAARLAQTHAGSEPDVAVREEWLSD